MAARGAAGGFVVTSGRFTGEARAFAAGRNVELVDGGRLVRMIDRVQSTKASRLTEENRRSFPLAGFPYSVI